MRLYELASILKLIALYCYIEWSKRIVLFGWPVDYLTKKMAERDAKGGGTKYTPRLQHLSMQHLSKNTCL